MEILTLNIRALKCFLLWPKDNLNWLGNTAVSCLHLTVILMSSIQTLAAIIYQLYIGIEDMNIICESFIGISDCFGFIFIYFCFRKNHGLIKTAIKESSMFLKFCTPEVLTEAEEEVRTYTKGLLLYFSFGLTFNGLIPLYDYENCDKRRLSDYYRQHDPCGMPTRIWVPFDARKPAVYYSIFLLHANACLNICYGVLCITMTLVGLLIHISAQIKNLRQNLSEIFDEVPDAGCESTELALKLEGKLKFCVKYHITIINYTNQVFAAFNLMLIVHVTLTSLIFGVLGYQIATVEIFTEKLRYFMHLGGWIALLFLTCYYGQLILDESTTVANAAYQSKWYNGPTYLRKNICLIIMRSQKPLKLRAASIGVISLETFVSVIKTAYSYFALLLSISE
nr:odorant receptor [Semanotus bifasciatus]